MDDLIRRLEEATEGSRAAELVHYSAKPFAGPVRSVAQHPEPCCKPRGFWISVEGNGDGWKDWCEGEDWNTEGLAYAHAVVLKDDARILWLRGPAMLLAFNDEWRAPDARPYDYNAIRWNDLAERYQGIIIAPYIWSLRLDDRVNWYYSWDCASGCIWDAGAIASFAALRARQEGK